MTEDAVWLRLIAGALLGIGLILLAAFIVAVVVVQRLTGVMA
jgi:hypothetical protein